jgi:protocatechuate 3,4-dioxygenase beta subunit
MRRVTAMNARLVRRRRLITTGTAVAAVLATAQRPLLAALGGPTPAQSEGPFYPPRLPDDRDADLVRVTGSDAAAMGVVTHVMGRVLARDGRPLPGVLVEIWQCDANGRYRHPRERGRFAPDPGFQGYGQTLTDASGAYRFRTIRPVAYPGRTPHIHFKLSAAAGELLTTQMYVAGEPGNEWDGLLTAIRDLELRRRLLVDLVPADAIETGALAGTFDIVVNVA